MSVPTYGTILLTPDMKNCLLVQSFFTKNSWGFPKGKVNENEDPVKCAIREVYEETGFDSGHLINENDFIEGQTSNFQYTRLYIVKNVPIDTKFCPRTRNEIKDCAWFVVDDLPNNRNDDGYVKDQRKIRANSFYMILPFISKLKHWIANERFMSVMGNNKKRQQNGHKNGHHIVNNSKKNHSSSTTSNFQKQSASPFFHNNNNNMDQARRLRQKSTGDTIETFSPVASNCSNGTFYNDAAKATSTPIASQGNSPFMTSSASAFRATNSDLKLPGSYKKKLQMQQHLQRPNGKMNHSISVNHSNSNQDHIIKRKLFTDIKENIQPITAVKPFSLDMPECWKNFKFDHQKLFNSICM